MIDIILNHSSVLLSLVIFGGCKVYGQVWGHSVSAPYAQYTVRVKGIQNMDANSLKVRYIDLEDWTQVDCKASNQRKTEEIEKRGVNIAQNSMRSQNSSL